MEETYKKTKDHIHGVLAVFKCTYCGGWGHFGGQCSTFRRVDSMIKLYPREIVDLWIAEKKTKVNTEIIKRKRVNSQFVIHKQRAKLKKLEADVQQLESNLKLDI
jgi:hypothetical protein